MKINKKQIVMLTLALIVCIAVYLNWRFLQIGGEQKVEETATVTETNEQKDENVKTLGEAEYVSAGGTSVEQYFTGSRLTRKQSKDEALELLQAVVDNESSSADSVAKANAEIVAIAEDTALEGTIENLIKAKGFEDCVVFISSDVVNVVVKTAGLTPEQAAQINEIAATQTGMPTSKIKIVEIKS